MYDWHFGTSGSKRGFIVNLSESLTNNGRGHEYSDLHFQLGKAYSSTDTTIKIDLSDKFGRVVGPNASIVGAYNPSASTMTQYCTALNNIVNPDNVKTEDNPSGKLDVNWLIDSGETALI